MATYASRPAWELRARAATSARVVVPLGLGLLIAVSLLLRTRQLDIGYWIDEGLSVGIADRPLTDIPGVLRVDGSPPLYYMLLHVWMSLFGAGEPSTRAFSLLIALACVPVAWWSGRVLFGVRTAWIAAVLAALNPWLTTYAQEARMYSLTALLGWIAMICFLRAFALPGREGELSERVPRRWLVGFAVSLAAMMYTHNWALFFALALGVVWLALIWHAEPADRRSLVRDGLWGFGGTLLLYAPWIPTLMFQAAHTGAPWSKRPTIGALGATFGHMLGYIAQVAMLLAAGAGVMALLERRDGRRLGREARVTAALIVLGVLTLLFAWLSSQASPAWAVRYLAVALPPVVLLCAAGLAHAGRLGLVGLAVVVVLWVTDGAPTEKSNVRAVAEAIGPSLAPGDLVISTQPEVVPVLHHYLPAGLRYATVWGPVKDVGVSDWRDGVKHLEGSTVERNLTPLLDRMRPGQRLVLVTPLFYDEGRWQAPWTSLVRARSFEWSEAVLEDRRFEIAAIAPTAFTPPRPNPVRATLLVKVPPRAG
jgi:mannosyltransferase